MPRYARSGTNINSLKLGRWRCLRQEVMHAGEAWRPSINGYVKFATLREQLMLPVHCCLIVTFTPMRWLESNWVSMLLEGDDGTKSPARSDVVGVTPPSGGPRTGIPVGGSRFPFNESMGLGTVVGRATCPTLFINNYLRVYNEHFKWPEDSDATTTLFVGSSDAKSDARRYGLPALPLEHRLTRLWDSDGATAADYELTTSQKGSREKFSLRDLKSLEARLKSEQARHWMSGDRYRDLLAHVFNVKSNNEVDQIPVVLDELSGYMAGRDLWATDSTGLGSVAGLMHFPINYTLPFRFRAPEHGVFAYFFCIRADMIHETGANPFATMSDMEWYDWVCDPDHIAKQPPRAVQQQDLVFNSTNSSVVGYEPRGQEWRTGWDCVDRTLSSRDSFFIDETTPPTSAGYLRKGSGDRDHAFRSLSLGNALLVAKFIQDTDSICPAPYSSIMAGT